MCTTNVGCSSAAAPNYLASATLQPWWSTILTGQFADDDAADLHRPYELTFQKVCLCEFKENSIRQKFHWVFLESFSKIYIICLNLITICPYERTVVADGWIAQRRTGIWGTQSLYISTFRKAPLECVWYKSTRFDLYSRKASTACLAIAIAITGSTWVDQTARVDVPAGRQSGRPIWVLACAV